MGGKKAITAYTEKPRPFKLLETGVRIDDTLNPIVEGGTGFIPELLERAKQCFNTPFPNKLKPTSLLWLLVVSTPTK